jgi:hypothetical protein
MHDNALQGKVRQEKEQVMRQSCIMIAIAAVLLIVGCSSTSDVQRLTLRCEDDYKAGSFIGLYSFSEGKLTIPPADADQVSIVYYFDGDDCSHGALMGKDDRPGYLFPIGQKSWSDLTLLKVPSEDMESVAALTPLTREEEGLAFWVKVGRGEYVLARIMSVQPTTYSDIQSGVIPEVELEWRKPRASAGK